MSGPTPAEGDVKDPSGEPDSRQVSGAVSGAVGNQGVGTPVPYRCGVAPRIRTHHDTCPQLRAVLTNRRDQHRPTPAFKQ
jgi:hypothetical protein